MVSQFPSLKNFKNLNKLIITKGEEQQAVEKSIREPTFLCDIFFSWRNLGKKDSFFVNNFF